MRDQVRGNNSCAHREQTWTTAAPRNYINLVFHNIAPRVQQACRWPHPPGLLCGLLIKISGCVKNLQLGSLWNKFHRRTLFLGPSFRGSVRALINFIENSKSCGKSGRKRPYQTLRGWVTPGVVFALGGGAFLLAPEGLFIKLMAMIKDNSLYCHWAL